MANEQKWTPGKWCVPDQTWRRELTVEVDGDNRIACPGSGGAMSYTETVCTMGWNGTPEWEANAQLIAAAPDMYEALRWALPLALMHMETIAGDRAKAGHSGLGTKRSSLYDSEVEAAERALAALLKARGE